VGGVRWCVRDVSDDAVGEARSRRRDSEVREAQAMANEVRRLCRHGCNRVDNNGVGEL
jgi:hypothetical protein